MTTGKVFYGKSTDNDLTKFKQNKLREVFNSKDLSKYDIAEIDAARISLLRYKTPFMYSWDWKYREVSKYLFKSIKRETYLNGDKANTLALFEILQTSYKFILNNNNTADIEYIHLALVEAVHEWLFMFQFDEAAELKKQNAKRWWNVIEYIANKLVDYLNMIYK